MSLRPRITTENQVWDVGTLDYVPMTQPGAAAGGLTDAQLRATPVPVSFTGGGDASAANQVTGNASLATIAGKDFATQATLALIKAKTDNLPAQGQALAAASTPVVLTAAQVTTLTPPAAIAGFALEAGHLAAIDTSTAKIPSQGQALAAASLPVVLTAAQLTTLTPPAAFAVTKTALTGSAPTTTSVGTSTGAAVAANANRKGLVLTNTHATNRISLGMGNAAVLDSGIVLYPKGVWVMDEYTFTTQAINAIASGVSTGLAIQELA